MGSRSRARVELRKRSNESRCEVFVEQELHVGRKSTNLRSRSAANTRTSDTVMRSPRMHGLPLRLPGSIVILSRQSMSSHHNRILARPRGGPERTMGGVRRTRGAVMPAAWARPWTSARRTHPRGGSGQEPVDSPSPRWDHGGEMKVHELEKAVLKLNPSARGRLAEKLLRSLETLSAAENRELWAEEAKRRDAELDEHPNQSRSAEDVLRDARSRLS